MSASRVQRLHAPQQIVERLHRVAPLAAFVAVAHAQIDQHPTPRVADESTNVGRQPQPARFLVHQPFNGVLRTDRLRAPRFDLFDALFDDLDPVTIRLNEFAQLHDQCAEHRRIVAEVVQHAQHDGLDLVVERIAFEFGAAAPADPSARELVQQLASGMARAAEEGLVENRDLQHRDLQAPDHCLHRDREIAIVEDVVEQHPHEIDGVLVGATHRTDRRAVRIGRTRQHELAQVDRDRHVIDVDRFGSGRVLGRRQHGHQLRRRDDRADRPGSLHRARRAGRPRVAGRAEPP